MSEPRKPMPLHTKILLGLVIGTTLGLTAKALAILPADAAGVDPGFRTWLGENLEFIATQIAEPIGKVFLRLIMMMVIPLVVSALALGVLELGDVGRLGRVGLKTLLYSLILSGCAVVIGIGLVNRWQPGATLSEEQREILSERYNAKAAESLAKSKQAKSLRDTLLDMIPENPLQEAVGALDGSSKGNGMLAVMFFALILGGALSVAGERAETVVKFLEGMFDVAMIVIGWAMKLAPYGVACLLFAITSQIGYDILKTLGWFVATALTGMLIQMLVVYPLMLRLVANRNPWQFYKDISEALLTAFGTSSSNATLPTALRVADEKLWLPNEISQFVLTIGSTANQNGTALYEGVVVLFLAQVFGVDLSFSQQVTVVLMSVLAGIGTAGVPGGSIPLIVIVLQSVGVPGEGIGIILGIDRILDMCRTVLNVGGDLVLAACVARKAT
ncbi:MAG: dicarboxylate/amino acid:cation symporter [Bythopirellula sp.]|nr:dicarboxylate/amino acid:cation symporter [Bythopirellula sp.]